MSLLMSLVSEINNHLFAFYVEAFFQEKSDFCLKDPILIHRMIIVLRMNNGDSCILFNALNHYVVVLKKIGKKELVITIEAMYQNKKLTPKITIFLPVLKRNNLEEAVSLLGKVGVTDIQLVYTQKSLQKKPSYDRLYTLLIAASEQAKNFSIPSLYDPLPLEKVLVADIAQKKSFVCGYGGSSLPSLLDVQALHAFDEYQFFIGPEQDFTPEEYALFMKHRIATISLGPLVLQASFAASLSVFLIRALFLEKNDSL